MQKGPLPARRRAAHNFFPNLLWGSHGDYYYCTRHTESDDIIALRESSVESDARAHRRSWNDGMMYGPRIINHSFTRGCHPAILQPFRAHRASRERICFAYFMRWLRRARMNASGRRNIEVATIFLIPHCSLSIDVTMITTRVTHR